MASYFIHQTIDGIPCNRVGYFPGGMTGLVNYPGETHNFDTGALLGSGDDADWYFFNFQSSNLHLDYAVDLPGQTVSVSVDTIDLDGNVVTNIFSDTAESILEDVSLSEQPCPIRVSVTTNSGLMTYSNSIS